VIEQQWLMEGVREGEEGAVIDRERLCVRGEEVEGVNGRNI
jgi:hypothetical protein